MSMNKAVDLNGDWGYSFTGGEPIAQALKVSSRGLLGRDRTDFLRKRAASVDFARLIDKLDLRPGDVPVHLIALGASEAYGPNRNGDGFKEACCKTYHDTFVKFAKWYRNHKNKDPKQSYGYIKHSVYNEPMKRIELLAILNGDEKAAERNGGHVATRELEKLAKGKDLAVSMACRVPYDVCDACGHKARTRDEYCKQGECSRLGCYDNLTKVAEDGYVQHVDNPHPTWFDMSDVFSPADRIAYGAKADNLLKAASDASGIGGAELAEYWGISAPLQVICSSDIPQDKWETKTAALLKLAYGLSAVEQEIESGRLNREWLRAFDPAMRTDIDISYLGDSGTTKMAEGLGALADNCCILDIQDFARLSDREKFANDAKSHLPGIYGRLLSGGSIERMLHQNRHPLSEKLASGAQRSWAKSVKQDRSVDPEKVRVLNMKSAIRSAPAPEIAERDIKTASSNKDAEELARDYAIYKLDCLHRIAGQDLDFPLTARLSVGQNYIIQ